MKILKYLVYTYLIIGSLFAIKFNYDYAKTHSFSDWLFFGELIPTAQGFIWPYYLINNKSSAYDLDENDKFTTQIHFDNSLNDLQKAFVIEEDNINQKIGFFTQPDKYSKSIELRKNALKEAKKVSLSELEKLSKEVADAYENKLIKGLELYFYGLENQNEIDVNRSTVQINEFGKIYREWRNE